jgi:hypothetical protein
MFLHFGHKSQQMLVGRLDINLHRTTASNKNSPTANSRVLSCTSSSGCMRAVQPQVDERTRYRGAIQYASSRPTPTFKRPLQASTEPHREKNNIHVGSVASQVAGKVTKRKRRGVAFGNGVTDRMPDVPKLQL